MSYVCFRVVDSPDKSEKFEVNRREGKKEKKKKKKKKEEKKENFPCSKGERDKASSLTKEQPDKR